MSRHGIHVYVLVRNEEANIGKCLAALQRIGARVTVLDSGSTDRSVEVARRFEGVTIRSYEYVSHEQSYNELTLNAEDEWVMVLDADMEIRPSLWDEIVSAIGSQAASAIASPLEHYVEGKALAWASLYPPKVYVFKGGRTYFVASGHGERLRADVTPVVTKERLVHKDRKPYEAFLGTQVFYGAKIIERWRKGNARWYDTIRLYSPLMALVMLVRSLIMRLGLLDGRTGLVYAMDRVIAELIFFRLSLADRMRADSKSANADSMSTGHSARGPFTRP